MYLSYIEFDIKFAIILNLFNASCIGFNST